MSRTVPRPVRGDAGREQRRDGAAVLQLGDRDGRCPVEGRVTERVLLHLGAEGDRQRHGTERHHRGARPWTVVLSGVIGWIAGCEDRRSDLRHGMAQTLQRLQAALEPLAAG